MSRGPETDELAALRRAESATGFSQPWAARAFAMVVGMFNKKHYAWPEWVDYFSAQIRAPGHYKDPHAEEAQPLSGEAARIDDNYSHMWLTAAEKLLADKGLISKEELDARVAELARARDGEAQSRPEAGPEFAVGGGVRVRDTEAVGSAHLALELLGKKGEVTRDLGLFPFAGGGRQRMYSVRFPAREIQGEGAGERDSLHYSLWESYLDPA